MAASVATQTDPWLPIAPATHGRGVTFALREASNSGSSRFSTHDFNTDESQLSLDPRTWLELDTPRVRSICDHAEQRIAGVEDDDEVVCTRTRSEPSPRQVPGTRRRPAFNSIDSIDEEAELCSPTPSIGFGFSRRRLETSPFKPRSQLRAMQTAIAEVRSRCSTLHQRCAVLATPQVSAAADVAAGAAVSEHVSANAKRIPIDGADNSELLATVCKDLQAIDKLLMPFICSSVGPAADVGQDKPKVPAPQPTVQQQDIPAQTAPERAEGSIADATSGDDAAALHSLGRQGESRPNASGSIWHVRPPTRTHTPPRKSCTETVQTETGWRWTPSATRDNVAEASPAAPTGEGLSTNPWVRSGKRSPSPAITGRVCANPQPNFTPPSSVRTSVGGRFALVTGPIDTEGAEARGVACSPELSQKASVGRASPDGTSRVAPHSYVDLSACMASLTMPTTPPCPAPRSPVPLARTILQSPPIRALSIPPQAHRSNSCSPCLLRASSPMPLPTEARAVALSPALGSRLDPSSACFLDVGHDRQGRSVSPLPGLRTANVRRRHYMLKQEEWVLDREERFMVQLT